MGAPHDIGMNARRHDTDMDFTHETWGMIIKAINYARGDGAVARDHAADFKVPKGCKLDCSESLQLCQRTLKNYQVISSFAKYRPFRSKNKTAKKCCLCSRPVPGLAIKQLRDAPSSTVGL